MQEGRREPQDWPAPPGCQRWRRHLSELMADVSSCARGSPAVISGCPSKNNATYCLLGHRFFGRPSASQCPSKPKLVSQAYWDTEILARLCYLIFPPSQRFRALPGTSRGLPDARARRRLKRAPSGGRALPIWQVYLGGAGGGTCTLPSSLKSSRIPVK